MRILIHDFGAYPFSIELSRELARRGHIVRYVYLDESGSVRGDVRLRPTDPANYSSIGIFDVDPKRRHSFARRLLHDFRYSFQLADEALAFRPDLVLSADCPLLSQLVLQKASASMGAQFVFWLQDLFGEALGAVVSRKNRLAGQVVSLPFKTLERQILRKSDNVLAIAPAFVDYVISCDVPENRIHLLPNWSPLSIPFVRKGDRWGAAHGLPDGRRVLYSGTLGLKHNPEILANLAAQLSGTDDHVVVVSEGEGRQLLETMKDERNLENLFLLDFQPSADLDAIFDSADVLLAILNADASSFSVPSKILGYMAAGKPIVGVMPQDNFSSQLLNKSGSGDVVEPGRSTEAIQTIVRLLIDQPRREAMGRSGRRFAEQQFAIEPIAHLVEQACGAIDITDQPIDLTPETIETTRANTV